MSDLNWINFAIALICVAAPVIIFVSAMGALANQILSDEDEQV